MIGEPKELRFLVDRRFDSLINSAEDDTTANDIVFFEGDSQIVRIYTHVLQDGQIVSRQLKDKEKLVLVIALTNDLGNASPKVIALLDTFEEILDDGRNICYEGVLSLNTQEVLDAFSQGNSTIDCTIEMVIIDELFGKQSTSQGSLQINRSILPTSALETLVSPSVNIGSYSTVVSLATGIIDQRIFDLKDGAPAEFDTLYELADAAQRVFSLHTQVGTFDDYLRGKELADAGLTVVSLGQIAVNKSTFSVSAPPSRPRAVDARIAP